MEQMSFVSHSFTQLLNSKHMNRAYFPLLQAPSKVSVETPAVISLSTITKKTKVTNQQISLEGGWRLVEGWKACPIGALPGRKVASLDL